MMRRPPIIVTAAVSALALLAGACTGGSEAFEEPEPRRLPENLVLAGRLQVFDDCDQLLNHLRAEGVERVGPFGLDDGYGYATTFEEDFAVAADGDAAPAPEALARSDGATTGPDFSETNVQEEGIDEPDTVETDGEYLYVLTNGTVRVLEAAAEPTVVAEIDAVNGTDMMLIDDRLVVFGTFDTTLENDSGQWVARSTVRLIDVSEPTAPAELEKMQVDGNVVSARAVDGRVHLVTSSQPTGFDFVTPTAWGRGLEGVFGTTEIEAENANRIEIVRSDLDDWLPRYAVEREGDEISEGRIADCASVYQPPEFAGLGTLTVSTIDPSTGLEPVGSAAVVSNGETVYASPDRLYVAMQGVPDETSGTVDEFNETSTIHAFDITGPAGAEYTVSGTVDGRLLDQFALSEHEGYLRVASTVSSGGVIFDEEIPVEPMEEPAPEPDTRFDEFTGETDEPEVDIPEPDIAPPPPVSASESFVTVLEETDQALVEVGKVGGLGRGEEIHSVRFVGDVGYVVTFRQIDPLYTVDLSDPSDPAVLGELKIQGYSAYLHPAGDGLLIGIGQDATETGMTLGTQISLFDVSDLSTPVRIDNVALGSSSSPVEFDHHAFLYHDGLAVVPVESYEFDYRSSALAFEVDPTDGIIERGTVTQPGADDGTGHDVEPLPGEPQALSIAPSSPMIERTVIVGDSLFTVSSAGVMATDLGSFEDTGWAPFE